MNQIVNIYCDESCHLEKNHSDVMVLGALACVANMTREVFCAIREIKIRHKLPASFEIKWTKVSPAKMEFYMELLDYFFSTQQLKFRAVVIKDKQLLEHSNFEGQTHDTWYYKMLFQLLKVVLTPCDKYRIYLDKKDTRSGIKIRELHDILCSSKYDFSREIIERVQSVHSHEIELLQLADLLIGAIGFANRSLSNKSSAKVRMNEYIVERSGYSLRATTLLKEEKMNLFFWQPQNGIPNGQ